MEETIKGSHPLVQAVITNFLGNSPYWYKLSIVDFLIINPVIMLITGWLLIFEFIFTLAMALTCYPLQPGGLLAIEAVAIHLTEPLHIYHEVAANLPVILLLMFMVAGIYFMKDMLLFVFTKLLLHVRNKVLLSLLFSYGCLTIGVSGCPDCHGCAYQCDGRLHMRFITVLLQAAIPMKTMITLMMII